MERVEHHGRTTAYRRRGDARVLCIHGSGGTGAVWRGQYRLPGGAAALDLSGHGESEDVDAGPGEALDAYAEDAIAVARETGARVLLGNSLGGAVALRVALSGFDPAALVIAGAGARLPVHPDLLDWLREDFGRAVDFLHGPDRLFHDPGDALLERSRETMRAVGPRVTHRDFAACDRFDARDRLEGIEVPVLALTGEHDTLTPPEHHERLADCLPRGRWTTVEDAAHLPMLERPGAFNAAVAGFLDDLKA